jgi:hypothetical protein
MTFATKHCQYLRLEWVLKELLVNESIRLFQAVSLLCCFEGIRHLVYSYMRDIRAHLVG